MSEGARAYALRLLPTAALLWEDKQELEELLHETQDGHEVERLVVYLEGHQHRTMDLYAPSQRQITLLIRSICCTNP